MYRVAPTGTPGRYAPHVVLTTTAPAWSAGTSATVTSTLANDGAGAAADVRLGISAPNQWTVTALTRTHFARIPRGGQAVATFRVTAPAVLPEPITRTTVSGTASGHASGGTWRVTASNPVELSAPVRAPFRTFSDTTAVFGAQGGRFAIEGAGADLWGTTDQYSAVYRHAAEHDGSTTVVELTAQARTSEWAKAGIMVRDDITAPGRSPGYLILAAAPGKGYVLQWDSTGSGHLDTNSAPPDQGTGTARYPSWLKLVRSGSTFTGYYSTDGTSWTRLAAATLPGVTATQDVGVFTSSHSDGTSGEADFSDFALN
nr:NEW3 domain-containing protein [Streptantibioticus rubrisoli]